MYVLDEFRNFISMHVLYNDVLCRQFGITFQIVDGLGAFAGHVSHV